MAQPRSAEDIYADFAQRRSGLLQALTDGGFAFTFHELLRFIIPVKCFDILECIGQLCRRGRLLRPVRS